MANSIEARNLKVGYGAAVVLPDFDVQIESGKITSILGANGCGKSTLLKALGRIIRPESGCVIVNDRDVSGVKNREIARWMTVLPQTPTAPGTLSCYELAAYGRYPYRKGMGRMSGEDHRVVEWALETTGLSECRDREIACLSGGQRQRAWIAMALAQQTGIILLDEPTTYLDMAHKLEILKILVRLNQEQGTTIVMALHDLNLASRYSDHLIAMKNGTIERQGTPQQVMTGDMLRACFGIEGDIVTDARSGRPACLSYELIQ